MSLGIYIKIEKRSETESTVDYEYTCDRFPGGTVRIMKGTGEVRQLSGPGLDEEGGHLFPRVLAKLKRHWALGEVPEKTHWTS